MNRRSAIGRRGSVGFAIVVILVIFQLLLLAVLMGGARDHDLATHRLDSARAGYAAEAGANMALRELMNNADEEGDGGIGTISNDANPSNDPALGNTRFYVTAVTAGSIKTLTSRGRCGSTRRQNDLFVEMFLATGGGRGGGSGTGVVVGASIGTGGGGGGWGWGGPRQGLPTFSLEMVHGAGGGGGAGAGGGGVGEWSGPGTGLLTFSRSSNNQPRYSLWNGTAWGASAPMPTIGGVANFMIARDCPRRNEAICVTQDDARDINALFYNGNSNSWSAATELCISTGQTSNRPFDGAYEQTSGDGLIVYWKNSVDEVGYRTYNGTTLSGEFLLSVGGASASTYMALYPQPRTDNIILLFENTTGGVKRLSAAVWNGTSWRPWTQLTSTSIASTSNECFNLAFEGLTNHAVCVYGENNILSSRYRTWNGVSWSAPASLPALAGEPQWIRLEADPSSNRILLGMQDAGPCIYVNNWTGSAWGAQVQVENDANYTSRRQFDLAYERGTGRAVIVYSQENQHALRYRTWNGSAWSAELIGADVGDTQGTVQVRAGPVAGQAFIAVQNDLRQLRAAVWNGSTMSAATLVESTLGGPTSTESFMLAMPSGGGTKPRVLSWQVVQPQ